MLELKQIVKDYVSGGEVVHALKGVDLRFRTSEFVSILGPSGCGKTTLLNIIGGLDQYTSGDLVIDGVSTKDYKDRDWDTYRNHSIGFVFQTYNLIPHQTVLKNVELALTLAGVPKSERKSRAIEALELVGLGDKINKRPNQLSGGQMQRVAIARALVNNPNIILADEPTGALDTETGIQVMELLKDVAKDRLVVMVTHNPELAAQYSSRIIRILDGEIVGDTAPLSEGEYAAEKAKELEEETVETQVEVTADQSQQASSKRNNTKPKRKKKSSMSLWTAFKLSLNNLFTKKGRTLLTSFAGSIGIIGIALILSVSQGMTQYIKLVQEQTLTTYPLTIQSTAMDMSTLVSTMMSNREEVQHEDPNRVYQRSIVYNVAKIIDATSGSENDLKTFKAFLDEQMQDENSKLYNAIAGLQYQYDLDLLIYTKNKTTGEVQKADPGQLIQKVISRVLGSNAQNAMGGYYASMSSFSMNVWQELLPSKGPNGSTVNSLLYDQYDLIDGDWPNAYNEVVLIVNENNEISDIALYTLGLIGDEYVDKIVDSFEQGGDPMADDNSDWSYKDIRGTVCKVILNSACYKKEISGEWVDWRETPEKLAMLYDDEKATIDLKITGIIRPNPDATAHMLNGTIGYTSALTEYVVEQAKNSAVVIEQENHPDTDILTGLPFGSSVDNMSEAQMAAAFREYFETLSDADKNTVYAQAMYVENQESIEQKVDEQLEEADLDFLLSMLAPFLGMDKDTLRAMLPEDDAAAKASVVNQIRPIYLANAKSDFIRQTEGFIANSEQRDVLLTALVNSSDEKCAAYYKEVTEFSNSTYEDNLKKMGKVDMDTPVAINIYAASFDAKDVIAEEIARYNDEHDEAQKITYTDFVALVMSAVTTIIDAVTYVLIAFVAISLIVSSIMIGVITLISVQERTKEIGILRAIGASKHDVSSMFNAETVIIGFAAGLLGVLVTYVLCIPINAILHFFTGIATLNAYLPPLAAVILVLISMGLTLLSGLIPSRSAAKKDPVVALRTE